MEEPTPPPPPAPTTETKSLAIGQTTAEVIAILGQPTRIVKAGPNKEIYLYPDLKLTFLDGKVSDIR